MGIDQTINNLPIYDLCGAVFGISAKLKQENSMPELSGAGVLARKVADRAKTVLREDSEGAKEAWRTYSREPSTYRVLRHELGWDRSDSPKRRKPDPRKYSASRSKSR